ncbi:MAG: OB-fold nucleic acid binding domain-containing protein [Candidatus Heimdallarchaeota archaeon]
MSGLRQRDTAIKVPIVELVVGTEIDDPSGRRGFHTNLGILRRVRVLGTVINTYSSEKEGKKPYTSLTLDDGTGMIRIKGWSADAKRLGQFKEGMVLDVIGRVRSSNDEPYITSELEILITDPTWELVRRLELVKQYKEQGIKPPIKEFKKREMVQAETFIQPAELSAEEAPVPSEPMKEPTIPKSLLPSTPTENEGETRMVPDFEDVKDQIIILIKEFNSGKGASYDELRKKMSDKPEKIFEEALMDLLKQGIAYEPSPARYKILK